MAHLAPGQGFLLTVKMKLDARVGRQRFGPIWLAVAPKVTQKIRHGNWREQRHVSQRQAAHRAELLFELAGDARVKAEVAGIVRSWRELIHKNLLADDEHFDGQQPDNTERFRDRDRKVNRRSPHGFGDICRRGRHIEDAILMVVTYRPERATLPVYSSGDNHAHLKVELLPFLDNAHWTRNHAPSIKYVGSGNHPHLSFSVISIVR